MPRQPRIHLENGFYHVTLRGNHQEPIFRLDSDRLLLNQIVTRTIAQSDAQIHAYCWMTNHVHLLIQVGTSPLGVIVRQIASGYARAFQRKLSTSGHLFERRYHARLVAADEYLLTLIRYIHLNPVKAGLVRSPASYRWSSHQAYAGVAAADSWLSIDFALGLLSADRARACAAYRRLVADGDLAWEPKDAPTAFETSLRPQAQPVKMTSFQAPLALKESIDSLIAEACCRFGIQRADLLSVSRDETVVRARAWVGCEALHRRIANLSEVARALGRDRATLRYAMRRLESVGHERGDPV